MAGFNVPTRMTPALLAQIAAAGFRPPQPMNMPGMSMPQAGGSGSGDSGLGAGIAGLCAGLGMLGGLGDGTIMNAGPQGSGPGGDYTTADAMGMAGLNNGMTLSPMDPSYGDLGGPGPRQAGGGFLDFLTGQPRGTPMANFVDPSAAKATNPYLSPPQAPDKWSVLGNLLLGAGVGISKADASARGWASGIAPGLLMGTQLTTNAQKQAEEMAWRRAQYAMMLDRRRKEGAR